MLAVLEVRVHLDLHPELLPPDYMLLKVKFDLSEVNAEETDFIQQGPAEPLALQHSREAGDEWLQQQSSLLLQVPSVIVPESTSLLLNPVRPLAASVSSLSSLAFAFDTRRFS